MTVQLLYFDDCPNWRAALDVVRSALCEGRSPELVRVTTAEEAERLGMRGSPTILVDGRDPFSPPDAPAGLACRGGAADAVPSLDQVRQALAR